MTLTVVANELEPENKVVDVVVIGAGLSGLAAANKLAAGGKSVIVLEAQGRVGGKVYDKSLSRGGIVEAGAEFIGPYQERIAQLAKEVGVDTFETYSEGSTVWFANGERALYDRRQSGGAPPLKEEELVQMARLTANINSMAQQLNVFAPWEHPKAVEWDSLTLASWLNSMDTSGAPRALVDLTIRALLSAEPEDVSLLQYLTYVSRAGAAGVPGNVERLTSVEGGVQERRFKGGPQLIAERLAGRLGAVIRLNSPVRFVHKEGDQYNIGNHTISLWTRSVICALSPTLAARISYQPPLPSRRDKLCQHMPMGSVSKVIAVYREPFWRTEGLSGSAVGLNGVMVQTTFDTSPSDGSFGAILGFVEGNQARGLNEMSEADIQLLVTEDFVTLFGEKARDVESWVIQRWDNEEYSRGGHFGICPPNVLTQYGPMITQSVGNIHFAGTEAAPYWSGFMEGAVQAGEIAAAKILK